MGRTGEVRANFGFCAGRSRERTDVTIEFRTARRGVRIVLFSCAGRERFATTRSGVRSCAVPMKRNLARAVFAHASNCGKRNSRPRRGGFASERGSNGRADFLYASLVACASRLLACGVARRPFGNGFCGSAPNSARSAGRSVDLIFSPAPCGCRAFFCLGERRRVVDSYASLKICARFADRIGSSPRSPRRRSIRLRRMRQPQRTSTEQK